MTRFITILCLLVAVLLSGCNLIYKQTIQQGNALEADDLQQLQLGMSKRQVSLILGTPAIHDPFHLNRWDYVYTFRPRGRDGIQRIITLSFEDGKLTSIEGDIDDILPEQELADSQDDEPQGEAPTPPQAQPEEGLADAQSVDAETSAALVTEPQPEIPTSDAAMNEASVTEAAITEAAIAEAAATEVALTEPPASTEVWTVQLGMFENTDNATALVGKLTSQDIEAWSEPMAESADALTRVLAGKYTERDQADALRRQISEQMGIEGLLARLPE